MSERPTTDEVRDAFAYETAMTMAELEIARDRFDDWLESVKNKAYTAGLEKCQQEADDNMRNVGY